MSHVAEIKIEVKDLAALEAAAKALGLVFDRESRHFRWYGRHVGDFPLPAGFSATDMGRCDVGELKLPNNPQAYSIGVCKRRDGKPGFTLLWDFYADGRGLGAAVGSVTNHATGEGGGAKLIQGYAEQVVLKQARAQGLNVQSVETLKDGTRKLVLQQIGGSSSFAGRKFS